MSKLKAQNQVGLGQNQNSLLRQGFGGQAKLKNFLSLILLLAGIFILSASLVNAKEKGVVEGQKIFEKLQKKEATCSSLKDNDFEKLGDYYMDQMMGASHESMDKQIERVYGVEGLKNMHIVMGKRMSGCDLNASLPSNMAIGMGMMGMMGSTSSPQVGGGGFGMMGPWGYGNMMSWGNWGGGFGLFWIFGLTFWVLILVILVLFAVWLWKQIQKK